MTCVLYSVLSSEGTKLKDNAVIEKKENKPLFCCGWGCDSPAGSDDNAIFTTHFISGMDALWFFSLT